MKTLIVDNYDSFTYNLVQYVGELNGNPIVFRNDKINLSEVQKLNCTHIILSPGPGDPTKKRYFGICGKIIKIFGKKIPILGVCLGHQGIIAVFGGKIIKAPKIMHGKTSLINHNSKNIFKNIKNPCIGMRYHSLIGEKSSLPKCFEITAESKDKIIMGIKHKKYHMYGIQFHPESIGTENGKKIIENFLGIKY